MSTRGAAPSVNRFPAGRGLPGRSARLHRRLDVLLRGAAWTGAMVVLVVTAALGITLIRGAVAALYGLGTGFFANDRWDPVDQQFGALKPILGTAMSAALALSIAVPLSLGIALFVTELAPRWLSRLAAGVIEVLAAIPSIVYGMWGLFAVGPGLGSHVQPWLSRHPASLPIFQVAPAGHGMVSASLVLGIMIVPYVSMVARDLFAMVPATVKEAAAALGATRWEVVRAVVLPHVRYGLVGAVILGLGRAAGETMAVIFLIGNRSDPGLARVAPSDTIATTIARELTGATTDTHLAALMALALCLFVLSCGILALGRALVMKTARKESA